MASIYAPVWEQLKQNPDTSLVYDIPPREHYTFKRMVQKLKWQDAKYRIAYPRARIFVSTLEGKLLLRLVHNPI